MSEEKISEADLILCKLNVEQLRSLIKLFSRKSPPARSTKSDIIVYIKKSGMLIDPGMLREYFGVDATKLGSGSSKKIMDTVNKKLKSGGGGGGGGSGDVSGLGGENAEPFGLNA